MRLLFSKNQCLVSDGAEVIASRPYDRFCRHAMMLLQNSCTYDAEVKTTVNRLTLLIEQDTVNRTKDSFKVG